MTRDDPAGDNEGAVPLASFSRVQAHVWLGTKWGITLEADLQIYPGRVTARIEKYGSTVPADATIIHQVDGVIRVNLARLPPWLDTAIFAQDDNVSCVLAMNRSKRRSLLQALEESGLQTFIVRRSIFTLYM